MRWMKRGLLVMACALSFVVSGPSPASAHPSDFETLTIDLLFGADGLYVIDAAVVESSGPSYLPGPTTELRKRVARRILEALGLSDIPFDIDLENSERYHWVGFTIRFHDPSLDRRPMLQFSTLPLQDIVADLDLKQLKLTICHGYSDSLDPRDIGRRIGNEIGCNGRFLTPGDEPHSITVMTREELPMTGVPITTLVAGGLVISVGGLALVTVRARNRRESWR